MKNLCHKINIARIKYVKLFKRETNLDDSNFKFVQLINFVGSIESFNSQILTERNNSSNKDKNDSNKRNSANNATNSTTSKFRINI